VRSRLALLSRAQAMSAAPPASARAEDRTRDMGSGRLDRAPRTTPG
jgi:hypothetical protein